MEEIRSDVIRMGGDANEMVRLAVEATLNGDLELANHVIASDDRVDEYERHAVNKTVLAVMQESPVAADLKFLVSTLGVVGEIEKVGDDAVKLARRATKLSGQFPAEMRVALLELGEAARRSFTSSIRLYSEYSSELQNEIVRGDKQIDNAYSQARNRVFDLIQVNPDATEYLVRTIEAFHALEHVADHAVAIAVRLRMLYDVEPLQS
jgi:phosphate transport system protein